MTNRIMNRVSASTIKLATKGDAVSIGIVLRRYEAYISKLSLCNHYDNYGNVLVCVNEELRQRLEIKLITAICSFEV